MYKPKNSTMRVQPTIKDEATIIGEAQAIGIAKVEDKTIIGEAVEVAEFDQALPAMENIML